MSTPTLNLSIEDAKEETFRGSLQYTEETAKREAVRLRWDYMFFRDRYSDGILQGPRSPFAELATASALHWLHEVLRDCKDVSEKELLIMSMTHTEFRLKSRHDTTGLETIQEFPRCLFKSIVGQQSELGTKYSLGTLDAYASIVLLSFLTPSSDRHYLANACTTMDEMRRNVAERLLRSKFDTANLSELLDLLVRDARALKESILVLSIYLIQLLTDTVRSPKILADVAKFVENAKTTTRVSAFEAIYARAKEEMSEEALDLHQLIAQAHVSDTFTMQILTQSLLDRGKRESSTTVMFTITKRSMPEVYQGMLDFFLDAKTRKIVHPDTWGGGNHSRFQSYYRTKVTSLRTSEQLHAELRDTLRRRRRHLSLDEEKEERIQGGRYDHSKHDRETAEALVHSVVINANNDVLKGVANNDKPEGDNNKYDWLLNYPFVHVNLNSKYSILTFRLYWSSFSGTVPPRDFFSDPDAFNLLADNAWKFAMKLFSGVTDNDTKIVIDSRTPPELVKNETDEREKNDFIRTTRQYSIRVRAFPPFRRPPKEGALSFGDFVKQRMEEQAAAAAAGARLPAEATLSEWRRAEEDKRAE